MSSNACSQVPRRVDGSRVVDSCGLVVHAHICRTGFGHTLLEAVSAGCTSSAVSDHLSDLTSGARILDASVVARSRSIMALHETRVHDTIVCRWCSHAAVALLQNDGENESRIDAGRAGD